MSTVAARDTPPMRVARGRGRLAMCDATRPIKWRAQTPHAPDARNELFPRSPLPLCSWIVATQSKQKHAWAVAAAPTSWKRMLITSARTCKHIHCGQPTELLFLALNNYIFIIIVMIVLSSLHNKRCYYTTVDTFIHTWSFCRNRANLHVQACTDCTEANGINSLNQGVVKKREMTLTY